MLYSIAIERGDEKHAHSVAVPDIPGCFSAGDSFDDALRNAKEAIEGHLETLAEFGDDIPRASTVDAHCDNPAYKGWVWAVVDIDISRYLGKSQKINVSLPERVIRRIDDTVAKNAAYRTRSGFLAQAALRELERF